jgi:hypothetical protein
MLHRGRVARPNLADYEKAIRAKDEAIRALVEENARLTRMIGRLTAPSRVVEVEGERRN